MTNILQLAPGIRVIQVPEQTPMRPVCTNIYLVGERRLTLIDTGVDEPRYIRAMFQGLVELGTEYEVAGAAITHSHMDHQGGLRWVRETMDTQFYAHPDAIPKVQPRLKGAEVQPMAGGSTLEADGLSLEVHHTPGHSGDSICYFHRESGVLLTGDTILGRGTTTIADLGPYMASLERLVELKPRLICPGHGPPVQEPEQVLIEYIEHRRLREQQILHELQRAPLTVQGLVNRIYKGIDKRLHRGARRNVSQHLLKLEKEERVTVEGAGARARYHLQERG